MLFRSRIKSIIFAFGKSSVEPFQNVGNSTGSVLGRVTSAVTQVGIPYPGARSIVWAGDVVYFIGSLANINSMGVYRVGGSTNYAPEKISTKEIDALLVVSPASTQMIGVVTLHQMTHVLVRGYGNTGGGSGYFELAFCIDTGLWWYLTMASSIHPHAALGGEGCSFMVSRTASNSEGNCVFQTAIPQGYTAIDGGISSTMQIRTAPLDNGTMKKKFCKSMEVVGEYVDTSGSNTLEVTYSDDDGQTFSNSRSITLDAAVASRRRLTRLGSYRRRMWDLQKSDATPFSAEAIEIEFDVSVT